MKIEIKSWITGGVLFSLETETLKLTLEAAVKAKTNLRGSDLRGSDLRGANLYEADLRRANLRRANLRGANLRGANLYGANLYGSDLRGANLRGANLYGADLRGSDLYEADLRGADLYEADLRRADLRGANNKKLTLIGNRPLIIIGPIGSRDDYLNAFLTDKGVYVKTGCFFGTLDKFKTSVRETHKDNAHFHEYFAAIQMIEVHAAEWTPEKEEEKKEDAC